MVQMKSLLLSAACAAAVSLTGCATEPGRVPGPGAFVAGVGSGLVNAHDAVARTLLGDAAKPMLIASPPSHGCEGPTPSAAVPAAVRVRQAASAANVLSPADATSADLDGDGAVSLDELVALGRCGV